MTSETTTHPERSLDRQIVLEEDEYTSALSHIIARDFFPSLARLDATNEYLDALHSQNPRLIGASVHRLQQIGTPFSRSSACHTSRQTASHTPYEPEPFDTPRHASHGQAPKKRSRTNTELGLDAFQARYTSEDNSSFTRIMESENQTRREKWAWAWDAQKRVETQRNKMVSAREQMLIEAPPVTGVKERFAIEAPTTVELVTDDTEAEVEEVKHEDESANSSNKKDLVLSHAVEASQVDVMATRKDSRSAGVDEWRFKARNSLMFTPDADVSPHHLVNLAEASDDPKVIKFDNTRFDEDNHSSSASRGQFSPPSPTRSRIGAAISGTPYQPRSPTSKNNFSLIPNLPSPTASELGPAAVNQLMTWGTLNATPRIVSQLDDPNDGRDATSFHLPAISHREIISQKLSNKASKSLRAKAGLLGLTPGIGQFKTPSGRLGKKGEMLPPSWTPRRSDAAGNLTPAARRLLDRTTIGAAATRRAEAMERSTPQGKEIDLNHVRWTPIPKV